LPKTLKRKSMHSIRKQRAIAELNRNPRALIIYGTSFGATKGTSEEIARILREESFDVKIVDAQQEKVKDISEYGLVVVGSSLAGCRWNNNVEDFLKKFNREFEQKKLALFVSSVAPIAEREGNTEEVAKERKIALEDKVSKYDLKPIMMGLFGGILNYNKMGFMARKGMEIAFKSRLQKNGFKESEPSVYDLRDWDKIRSWARELAEKARE
jgi:menaquinone-dependent protoporphyrinogen oxidase